MVFILLFLWCILFELFYLMTGFEHFASFINIWSISTNFNSTCCSLSFVPLLAWFSVNGNSIRSPWKFATSCIGSLWGRGSNSRFVDGLQMSTRRSSTLPCWEDVANLWHTSPATFAICNKGWHNHTQHKISMIWSAKFQRVRANLVELFTGQHQNRWNHLKTIENVSVFEGRQ